MGSSHGLTRIIRLAYHEDPSYVPLLRRAYALWRELERTSGERVLHITGSLEIGLPGSEVFDGALASCRIHDLPHEILSRQQINQRFPAYRLPRQYAGILQPDGGFLDPERCIAAHLTLTRAHGAAIHADEQILAWEPAGAGVRVHTDRATYTADRLVITAGAWLAKLVPALAPLAAPERQVLAWFRPQRPEHFSTGGFPVFILAVEEGNFYGFPMYGLPGLKIGLHHHFEEVVDPDTMERTANARDEAVLRDCVARYLPDGLGETLALKTCLYTNTPDRHFIVDQLPGCPQVVIGGGFSGHGFKFCSVMGEILADLALTGTTQHETGAFKLARFDQKIYDFH
jgi:sarcosine oxidase